MAGRKSDFTLTKLDDLFSTQEQRDEEKLSKIRDIPLTEIDDFPDHPFKVRDDEDISTSWKSQNESDANCIAHAYATQILIWETIVGERDASFNHVSTGGYNAVLECVSSAHPLRSKILSYYNSMVTSVQNHTKVPSFCTRSRSVQNRSFIRWNTIRQQMMLPNRL